MIKIPRFYLPSSRVLKSEIRLICLGDAAKFLEELLCMLGMVLSIISCKIKDDERDNSQKLNICNSIMNKLS